MGDDSADRVNNNPDYPNPAAHVRLWRVLAMLVAVMSGAIVVSLVAPNTASGVVTDQSVFCGDASKLIIAPVSVSVASVRQWYFQMARSSTGSLSNGLYVVAAHLTRSGSVALNTASIEAALARRHLSGFGTAMIAAIDTSCSFRVALP